MTKLFLCLGYASRLSNRKLVFFLNLAPSGRHFFRRVDCKCGNFQTIFHNFQSNPRRWRAASNTPTSSMIPVYDDPCRAADAPGLFRGDKSGLRRSCVLPQIKLFHISQDSQVVPSGTPDESPKFPVIQSILWPCRRLRSSGRCRAAKQRRYPRESGW